jgi:two-component system, CitB family, sensor kinase
MRRGSGRRLSSQIFVSQVSILLAVVLVGFGLFAVQERKQLDRQYMDEDLQIAQTVADTPDVKTCIAYPSPNCDGTLVRIAGRIQRDTKSNYVVIVDAKGIRHTHPTASLIGKSIDEPLVTAPNVRMDHGSIGTSVNGRVPLIGPLGDQIGEVSVGRTVA